MKCLLSALLITNHVSKNDTRWQHLPMHVKLIQNYCHLVLFNALFFKTEFKETVLGNPFDQIINDNGNFQPWGIFQKDALGCLITIIIYLEVFFHCNGSLVQVASNTVTYSYVPQIILFTSCKQLIFQFACKMYLHHLVDGRFTRKEHQFTKQKY